MATLDRRGRPKSNPRGLWAPRARRTATLPLVAIIAGVASAFMASCTAGAPTTPSAPSPVADPVADPAAERFGGIVDATVGVQLTEWSVTASPTSVRAGNIEFVVENTGEEPHELVIVRTDLPADALVTTPDSKVDESASGDEIGEIEDDQLPAGGSTEGVFTLGPGSYVLFCNLPEHYQRGMRTAFTVTEAPRPTGNLVIYSGRSEELVGPMIALFRQATGIDVRVRYGGTAELAATLLEEGRNSPADVFFAQDPGGLAATESLFGQLPTRVLDAVAPRFRSASGRWVGVSGRARVVVYNTVRLTEDYLPDDVADFVDPKWKGRIGWAPTNGSLQAMVTAMRELWGDTRTDQWLRGIRTNGVHEYPNNTQIVAAVGAGEIDAGFVNHYYLYRFLQEEGEAFSARNYHLRAGGPGAVILVAGAGVLQTAANRDNALRFVEFMLSPVSQQFFASQTFEYPVVNGVTTNRLLTPIEEIQSPNLDMASLGDLEGTLNLMRRAGALP